MKRTIIFFWLVISGTVAWSQSAMLTAYEYWFNDDYDNRTHVVISPVETLELNEKIALGEFAGNMQHTFHIRFLDNTGHWSTTHSRRIWNARPAITSYEYWFDDRYDDRVAVGLAAIDSLDLNVALPLDVFDGKPYTYVHIRFRDAVGNPGVTHSHRVWRSGHTISNYEYWFDDRHEDMVAVEVAAADTLTLQTGIPMGAGSGRPYARLHIRFRDAAGNPGPVESHAVWHPGHTLSAWEYWFDDNVADKASGPMAGVVSETWNKTLHIDSLSFFENIHVRFLDAAGNWSIPLGLDGPGPLASFYMMQDGYFVTYNNTTKLGNSYQWSLGDGTVTNQVNPSHTYSQPDDYLVELIATNVNGSDTLEQILSIRGVQSVIPTSAGNGGYATMTIRGGGLMDASGVKLTAPGTTDIHADTLYMESPGNLKALFNLSGQAMGTRSVHVEIPGVDPLVVEDGFAIEGATEPEILAQVGGSSVVLVNRWQTYTVQYSNMGNNDAYIVPFWIVISDIEGLEISFTSRQITLPEMEEDIYQVMLDSVPFFFPIDSLNGEPFKARAYPLFLPIVPASETGNFTIRIKSPENYRIVTWVDGDYLDVAKSSDYDSCVRWAMLEALTSGLVGLITDQIPGATCLVSVSQLYLNFDRSSATLGSVFWSVTRSAIDCVWDAGSEIPLVKAYSLTKGILSLAANIYEGHEANEECKRLFKSHEAVAKGVSTVNSFDPNDITGPSGFEEGNYYFRDVTYPYLTRFENKDDATAPAQEVFITDSLEVNSFDLASFELGNIGFGDSIIYVPPGNQAFTTDVDMRPVKDIILRINASLDTEHGVAHWVFRSLDPETMDLTEDPFGGFLPPNINSPEGEGFVSYTIRPKGDLEHLHEISAQASIVFDLNEPIITNRWINRLDLEAPVSAVNELPSTTDQESFLVSWDGEDEHSGIASYAVFYSVDGSQPIEWKNNTWHKNGIFEGTYGSTYRFYSVARDKLGNQEVFSGTYHTSITLEEPVGIAEHPAAILFDAYPNPASGMITVQFTLQGSHEAQLTVYDLLGRVQHEEMLYADPGETTEAQVNISAIPKGTYFFSLETGNSRAAKRIVIQ